MTVSSSFRGIMKLLLDQGMPRSAASLLSASSIDIGFAAAEDVAILQLARESGRIVVTVDADFHSLLATSRSTEPSVIRIRMEGLQGQELAELLTTVLAHSATELESGAAVTVQPGRIRIRLLPLLER
jgi:predicted nuclease of predicted toxin-antitoxin system